jgi:hypothetical protein
VEAYNKWVDIMSPFIDALEAVLGDEYSTAVDLLIQAIKHETAWIDEYKRKEHIIKPERLRRDIKMKDICRKCLEVSNSYIVQP